MQVAILALACLGTAAVSLVQADPVAPATEPTAATQEHTPVPSPPAADPARSEPSAVEPTSLATSTAVATDPDEQYAMSHGYKPELHKGVKVFCRREDTLGSRVSPVKVCGRAKDLKQLAERTQRDVDRTRVGQQNSQPDSAPHGSGNH
jgi:hypothetical protein